MIHLSPSLFIFAFLVDAEVMKGLRDEIINNDLYLVSFFELEYFEPQTDSNRNILTLVEGGGTNKKRP